MVPSFRYGSPMTINTDQILSKTYAPAVQSRLSLFPSKDQLPIASWLIKTPISSAHLDAFEEFRKKIGLPVGCELIPPKNFESQLIHRIETLREV